MKGIVLAGGVGSRLFPLTQGVSKQLLPVYDKPMIYYPLSVLMLCGIREILIITTGDDASAFKRLLGDGSNFGVSLTYAVQPEPLGLAHSFIVGKDFIGTDDVCLILGDNIFYGQGFSMMLQQAMQRVIQQRKASIFGYYVKDPERYGVAEFSPEGEVISIEEKPHIPKSNYAVVGLYFYPNQVVELAQQITPSQRGELEITSINEHFLKQQKLHIQLLGRGFAWLDTGTHDALSQASVFVETIEKRQGLKIACIEEIAYKNQWISAQKIREIASKIPNPYGQYLLELINQDNS